MLSFSIYYSFFLSPTLSISVTVSLNLFYFPCISPISSMTLISFISFYSSFIFSLSTPLWTLLSFSLFHDCLLCTLSLFISSHYFLKSKLPILKPSFCSPFTHTHPLSHPLLLLLAQSLKNSYLINVFITALGLSFLGISFTLESEKVSIFTCYDLK